MLKPTTGTKGTTSDYGKINVTLDSSLVFASGQASKIEVRVSEDIARLLGLDPCLPSNRSMTAANVLDGFSEKAKLLETSTIKLPIDFSEDASKVRSFDVDVDGTLPNYLYICCNLTQEIIYGNITRPILATIPMKLSSTLSRPFNRSMRTQTISNPTYLPLKHLIAENITFSIVSDRWETPRFRANADGSKPKVTLECQFELHK